MRQEKHGLMAPNQLEETAAEWNAVGYERLYGLIQCEGRARDDRERRTTPLTQSCFLKCGGIDSGGGRLGGGDGFPKSRG
jgi:hypothetical protein